MKIVQEAEPKSSRKGRGCGNYDEA